MIAILVSASTTFGQTLAFPGALGFGANATGGRTGTVYRVTTLADSGPGSFRDAVSQPNRIVIFNVGGYITVGSEVSVKSHITIAGQTAPGGGIAIRGDEVSFGSQSNIICRHVRFRPGSGSGTEDNGLNLHEANNIILDHVSIEFAKYNNIDATAQDWQNHPVTGITVQNCLIADPIGQQFCSHTESVEGQWSWFYNVFANNHGRAPLAKIDTVYINNVVYNYEYAYACGDSGTPFTHDIVNNYYIVGPATDTAANDYYQIGSNQSLYESGNLRDSNENGVLDGTATFSGEGTALGSPWSSITPTIPTYSPANVFRRNLSIAGAWPRDQVDNLIINEVRSVGTIGPNPLASSQTVTGLGNNGFGVLNGGPTPVDTDSDGMPNFWEAAVGLNPNVNDAMMIDGDGYANIENYINWLGGLHVTTPTNAAVDVDLWALTSGFTNTSVVYEVSEATNGTVSLVGDHIARFVPATNYSGLGSFRFAVSSSDGNYTNTVGVLVSAIPPPSNLIWRGDGVSNTWDVGATTNWDDGASVVTFTAGDNVTFDDSGSNSPAINLVGNIAAGVVSVVAEQDYTFSGTGGLEGGTSLYKVGDGQLTFNNVNAFSGVIIAEGTLQVGDGVSFNGGLSGVITNNDTLIFANPSSTTNFANIGGTGVVIKNAAGALTLSGSQSYTNLTTVNDGSLTFAGAPPAGNILNNTVVIFRPPGAATYSGIISGPGRVQTSASSITTTLSGANTFSGGINITSGNLQLAHSRAAGTGLVTNSSSGLLYVGNGTVITNDFVHASTATTDLGMRCDSGTGVWSGNVYVTGSGASWRPGSAGSGTLVFTGTADQGSRNFIVPRGTFHMASNAVVSATGTATALGRDSTDGGNGADITIRNNANVSLGLCSMGGARAGGNVTVTLQDNATLSTGVNNFDLHNVNRSTAITIFRLNGGTMIAGGFIKTRTGASQLTTMNLNGGMLKAGANNASFLPLLTGLTANVQAGGAKIHDDGFAITIAQPLVHDASLGAAVDGGLRKSGSGTLTLSGVNTYNGGTTISNGTLALSGSGSIANTTNINILAGATLDVSGASGGGITLGSGRKLLGNGLVKGNMTIGSSALLTPGSSIGTLTFSNDLVLSAGSTNVFEISKSPLTNDIAKVLGTVTLGGTLIVTNVAGTLAAGDSFKLIDAAGYSGSFNSLALPPLDGGLAWNTNGLATNGVISVVALVPTVVDSITRLGGGGFRLTFSGTEGQGYEVRATTNLALSPVTLWDLLETGTFGPVPVIYDDLDATNFAKRFYRIRTP